MSVLLVDVGGAVARFTRALFGQVALVRRRTADCAALFQTASVAARPRRTLRLRRQLARDRIAARVHRRAVVDRSAVALFAILDDFVPARATNLHTPHTHIPTHHRKLPHV